MGNVSFWMQSLLVTAFVGIGILVASGLIAFFVYGFQPPVPLFFQILIYIIGGITIAGLVLADIAFIRSFWHEYKEGR